MSLSFYISMYPSIYPCIYLSIYTYIHKSSVLTDTFRYKVFYTALYK